MMWGGSRSETVEMGKILSAMSERDSRQDELIKGLERLANDNALAINNLIVRFSGWSHARQIFLHVCH